MRRTSWTGVSGRSEAPLPSADPPRPCLRVVRSDAESVGPVTDVLALHPDDIVALANELGVTPTTLLGDAPAVRREFVKWIGGLDPSTLAEVADLVAQYRRHLTANQPLSRAGPDP